MKDLKSQLKLRSRASRFLKDNKGTIFTALGSAALGAAAVYLYASRVEARNYRLEKLKVAPRVEVGAASGSSSGSSNGAGARKLKILHLSDLHLAAPESHKIEFLQRITDEHYDLVIFTGDIFENYTGMQYAKHLVARQPRLGAFAVLGNHDYYDYTWFHKTYGRINRKFRHPSEKRDVTPLIDALEQGGITVLRNSSRVFAQEKTSLIGIDYPGITPEQLCELTAEAPADHLVMAMLHLPRRLHQLPEAGVHLAFAGHTHGGQIRLPGFGALITDSELPRKEASGLVRREQTLIHVSRGLGADPKTNFRLFCPPAATVVEVEHG